MILECQNFTLYRAFILLEAFMGYLTNYFNNLPRTVKSTGAVISKCMAVASRIMLVASSHHYIPDVW